MFQCLPVFVGFLLGTSQRLASKAYTVLLQITPVGSAAVSRIRQDHLRIVAVSCLVRFHLTDQILAFVKGIPAYGNTLAHQTDAELGTKLHWLIQFASHNGAHIGLADADNTVITAMTAITVHLPLLRIQVLDDPGTRSAGLTVLNNVS